MTSFDRNRLSKLLEAEIHAFEQNNPRSQALFKRAEATRHGNHELDRLLRLFFLNRSIMLTIFYNVALVSPETSKQDLDRHSAIFREFVQLVMS